MITKIKAGSVSSLSDARYFAGVGVDWLGFNVDASSDSYVNPELYKNIIGWVSGPKRVIELHGNVSKGIIEDVIIEYVPDFLETELEQIEKLPDEFPCFARANLASLNFNLLEEYSTRLKYLLLKGDDNIFENVGLIKQISDRVKILLSIPPESLSVRKALIELPISGLALLGSVEQKAGLKVYDYSDLLESLEE